MEEERSEMLVTRRCDELAYVDVMDVLLLGLGSYPDRSEESWMISGHAKVT